MRPPQFLLSSLQARFAELHALTMPKMKAALGTQVDGTVFRKLAALPYRTSYSQRGRFYTLDALAQFDEHGLWECRGAWFSRHGTLLESIVALVAAAPAGYFASELQARLHVAVKDALRLLVRQERLHRQILGDRYFYAAPERARQQAQWAARQALLATRDPQAETVRAAVALFYGLLDEQQRRLYAGLESLKRGHGGDTQMAQWLGLDAETVARGRRELLAGEVQAQRVRRPGGKKTPALLTRLQCLLQEDTAGDPTGRRKLWTGKRLRQITAELRQLDIQVSPNTVRRLLRQLEYGLHANVKRLARGCSHRDEQFTYLAAAKQQFLQRGLPVISVDTKKKELIGNFKNAGRVWSQAATPVKDHNFRSEGIGMAIPYGVYDLARNHGSVFVGTSHDTPQFAAENIARWWQSAGRKHYPDATQIFIWADSGGSNGARVRMWKWALQQAVADRFGLGITVGHYPTGASKWNPIEHRCFSEISKHWAGQPLDSYDTIVSLIGGTETQTGLRVESKLIAKHYATDLKVTNHQMDALNLERHAILPAWNYTIWPHQNRN